MFVKNFTLGRAVPARRDFCRLRPSAMPFLALRPSGTFRSILRFLPFLLPLADLFVTPASGQEPTWIVSPVNGNSYALTPPGSWEATQQWANANGAHLVAIRSAAEQEWVRATFASANAGGLWIGLNDFQTTRVWRWVNGDPVTYLNWASGEPNNTQERTVRLLPNGGWGDHGNGNALPGIAERAAPLPSTLTVWNIRAFQRPGTKILDIYYNLHHPLGFYSYVTVEISQDAGVTYGTVPTMTGAFGGGITPGMNKALEWRAATDWTPALYNNVRVRISADDGQEMRLIPGGTFEMGYGVYTPVTTTVDPFYMARTEVTSHEWERIRSWAVSRGYTDLADPGVGTSWGAGYPSISINWLHAVQWLNAKSEMEGLTPVYFATVDRLELYRRGGVQLTNSHVNWSANGYRLPTEAEWEWAARGGLTNKLYPWGDQITSADSNFSGGPRGVVSYATNGYGLYEMAGNVWEWVWDAWQEPPAGGTNPRGPNTWGYRQYRGGSFRNGGDFGTVFRAGFRHAGDPLGRHDSVGFRYVRNATP
jgi:formylglycine-generating enzyme required for sulfatase activity